MQLSSVARAKASLRTQLSDARASFRQTSSVVGGFEKNVIQLIEHLKPRVIAGYLPFANEPKIQGSLKKLIDCGLEVLMPVVKADGALDWVSWNGKDVQPGILNFDEARGLSTSLSRAELVLVPALAATLGGARLGKGKGFYDRALLAYRGTVAAVIFEAELIGYLPTEPHDVRVDFVITETRLIEVG